jgi:GntR family transcriptional regulator, rspAB operon transcriptional repressor
MQRLDIRNKPKGLSDWAYDYIKTQILNLEIKPGEQIDIESFTEMMGVSRTPIREAFLRLASDGLLDVRPRVGYFVMDITEEDIRELFEVREIIESRAARRAAESLTDEELDELRLMIEELKRAVKNEDFDIYLANEINFHEFLQRHMGNRRLTDIMESLNDLTYRERIISLRNSETFEKTIIEHERVVEALLKRDGDEAAWFMGEHLKNASDRVIAYIRSKNELEEIEQYE